MKSDTNTPIALHSEIYQSPGATGEKVPVTDNPLFRNDNGSASRRALLSQFPPHHLAAAHQQPPLPPAPSSSIRSPSPKPSPGQGQSKSSKAISRSQSPAAVRRNNTLNGGSIS